MRFEEALSGCRLCPRACGADRGSGRTGYCGAGGAALVYSFGSHPGEEPPISGTNGSGTVFFSRCTMRCLYCQNYRFSQSGAGREYDIEGLAGILRRLWREGCHNWNLVSPTPWLPFIVPAIERLNKEGVSLPVVYNTSGYESPETLGALSGVADLYLTDLRYASNETAAEASDAGDYVTVARAAALEMWRQKGALRSDADGIARSGMICRILVLPGHADEAVANLRWLADEIGSKLAVSVMAQYTPAYRAVGKETWGRRITGEEYESVRAETETLGFESGWVQDRVCGRNDELAGYNLRQAAGGSVFSPARGSHESGVL